MDTCTHRTARPSRGCSSPGCRGARNRAGHRASRDARSLEPAEAWAESTPDRQAKGEKNSARVGDNHVETELFAGVRSAQSLEEGGSCQPPSDKCYGASPP